MVNEKPEALRLADRITMRDYYEFDAALHCPPAAAELRRLHEENTELLAALNAMLTYTANLNPAQGFDDDDHDAVKQAFVAINKAERTTT